MSRIGNVLMQDLTPWFLSWFGKVFSKEFSATRVLLTFTIAQYFVMAPIQPWMPEKSELYEIAGEPRFQHVNTIRGSATHFFVNNELVHCSFSGLGGANACEQFSNWIDVKRPVKVTYFWMRNRFLIGAKVLNSLEQDGRMIISPNDSLRFRMAFFEVDKKWKWVVPSLFIFLTLFVFLVDKYKVKYKLNHPSTSTKD